MKTKLGPIESYLKDVSISIEKELKISPPVLMPIMNHLLESHGKNMRAALVLAVAHAFKNKEEKVVKMAAAIELMHLSTLIHDDIIDDAPLRRGIASVHAKFGKKMAVIAGDYLFTKCFKLVSENNKNRIADFSKTVGVICVGEALQHQFCTNVEIRKADYLKIIAGKTAAMFAMAMYGSAKECGASKQTAERLARAGYYLGLVFQMVDDCLDYSGDMEKTKKSLYTDLQQGIITLPLIHTLKVRPELKELFKHPMTDEQKLLIIESVKKEGGVAETHKLASKYYALCKKKIEKALPRSDKELLYGILDSVYYREE